MSAEIDSAERTSLRTNRLDLLERVADDLAHEIKNPLHSMVINLEVLRRRVGRIETQAAPELLRYVEILSGELERVNRRIELLLHLVRPGRNGDAAVLSDLLEEMLELIELEAARRSVHVEYRPAPAAARVHLPRDPTRQVVLNLVFDALDALVPGGTLALDAREADGALYLVVSAIVPNGAPSAPDAARRAARLEAARALGQTIGARVETLPTDSPGLRLALSLPLSG